MLVPGDICQSQNVTCKTPSKRYDFGSMGRAYIRGFYKSSGAITRSVYYPHGGDRKAWAATTPRHGYVYSPGAGIKGSNYGVCSGFSQTQLAQDRDYSVFLYTPQIDKDVQDKINSLRSSTTGGHADEVETGVMMYIRPDLVKKERASQESGADMNRLVLPNGYTGI